MQKTTINLPPKVINIVYLLLDILEAIMLDKPIEQNTIVTIKSDETIRKSLLNKGFSITRENLKQLLVNTANLNPLNKTEEYKQLKDIYEGETYFSLFYIFSFYVRFQSRK